MTSTENTIAKMLQVVGGIIIAAYGLRAMFLVNEFGGGTAFEVFLQGAVLGVLLIGFSEVIKLMQGIFNQREPERPVEGIEKIRRANLERKEESTVSLESRNRVMDYFAKRNLIIDDIEATPYEGYVIVHHEGKSNIVDLNNWELEVLTESQLRKNPELGSLVE